MDALLQRVQIRPLATGIDRDSQLLRLANFTSEVANSALDVLQDAALRVNYICEKLFSCCFGWRGGM